MGKKNFYIAKIDGVEPKAEERKEEREQENKFQSERFVSSFYGTKVKDVPSFPYIKYGNRATQYESFRDQRKITEHELENKYGTKYYEFYQIQGTKPKRLDEEESTTDNSPSEKYKEDGLEVYTKEPYAEPYREDFGKLRDLPEIDDEYDFGKTVYTKDIIEEKEIETVPIKQYRVEKPSKPVEKEIISRPVEKTVEGYDTKRINVALQNNKRKNKYEAPLLTLLKKSHYVKQNDYSSVNYQKEIIDKTLNEFRIGGRVVHFTKGPTVTQFEIKLDGGVKVEKVKNIQKNLQMNLEGKSIRIEAPIPGKSTVGIEVPNLVQDKVLVGDQLSNEEFLSDMNPLNVVLGIDIAGNFVDLDISSMPHALIAGTTGSGKSVCINTIIMSILYKASPEDVRLILIDPKLIEFSAYEDIPHLATPVINDPKLANAALKWAVDEMQNRYELFKACKRRDITSYNELAKTDGSLRTLPYIVIIIDELADLMFVSASSVEEYIARLAQKARAAGIHLIVATQRPSTDVIKGLIKANIQTRIAFAVNSQVDSMTILDRSGAEKLLGKGDMLYHDGVNEIRVQGAYVTLEEILAVTDYIKKHNDTNFMFTKEELTQKMNNDDNYDSDPRNDEYFEVIARFVVENDSASINRIQKEFGVGFNRAQSIMNGLEYLGVVSEGIAGRPRKVLITIDELEDILNE